jgi:hypothetical protein
MAELLLRQRDRSELPVEQRALTFRRGDVIVACPNNWAWTQEELTNPDWRILALPSVGLSAINQFLQPELTATVESPDLLQKRLNYLDVDAASLPQALKNWWRDDTRASPKYTINLTGAQLLAYIKTRESRILVL